MLSVSVASLSPFLACQNLVFVSRLHGILSLFLHHHSLQTFSLGFDANFDLTLDLSLESFDLTFRRNFKLNPFSSKRRRSICCIFRKTATAIGVELVMQT